MTQRIITTIVLWLGLIGLLWFFGAPAGVIVIAAMAVATQHELYQMLEKMGMQPFRKLGLALGAAMILGPYAIGTLVLHRDAPGLAPTMIASAGCLLAAAVILCCVRILNERQPAARVPALVGTVFGLVLVPFMLHFFICILFLGPTGETGLMLAVWLVAVAKFCDTGALLVGTAVGRRPLAPSISPKKTWEGAIGGVLVAALVGAALPWLFPAAFPATFTGWFAAAAAVPVAAFGIVSDLVESVIKRLSGVKDSGRAIPGIGGAFDLTDSVILAAPVGYLIFAAAL